MSKRRDIRRSGKTWEVLDGVSIPAREVKVENRWIEAPRHINRIDIPNKKTHGWQVRYRDNSKFFSDVRADDKSPEGSLENAKAFLKTIYKDDQHIYKFAKISQEHKDKGLKLYPGVSGLWRCAPGRSVFEFYFQVIVPVYGPNRHRNIKIYVCTENTLNREFINSKAKQAIAIRRYFENLYKQRDIETAKTMTLTKFDGVDLSEFERSFPPISNKKMKELLQIAKEKYEKKVASGEIVIPEKKRGRGRPRKNA